MDSTSLGNADQDRGLARPVGEVFNLGFGLGQAEDLKVSRDGGGKNLLCERERVGMVLRILPLVIANHPRLSESAASDSRAPHPTFPAPASTNHRLPPQPIHWFSDDGFVTRSHP